MTEVCKGDNVEVKCEKVCSDPGEKMERGGDDVTIKEEPSEEEYPSDFVTHVEGFQLKTEEIDLECDCLEHSLDFCPHRAGDDNGVEECEKPENVTVLQTIKVMEDNTIDAYWAGDLKLKTEEIDLGCGCIEHSLCSHVDETSNKIDDKIMKYSLRQRKVKNSSKITKAHALKHGHKNIDLDDPLTCKICKIKFCKTNSLNRHMKRHTGEKQYACNVCNKKFTRKYIFHEHMLKHTEYSFACTICEKKFHNETLLNEHMSKHKIPEDADKPHVCPTCGWKFQQKGHLTEHMFTHTGEKPNKCHVCGKKFTQKSTLSQHVLTHKEKSYTCAICNHKFFQKKSLKQHVVRHAGVKPYACNVCEKTFYRKCYLNQHLLSHDKTQRKCEICKKKFSSRLIAKHMKTHE